MKPEAIRAASAFLRSEAGGELRGALEALTDPTKASKDTQERMAAQMHRGSRLQQGLTDRFYDATAKLPRAPMRSVPAPPPPPPPPRAR